MADIRTVGKGTIKLIAANPHIEVWAGGGIVHRQGDAGPEVLLVHRPHHGDWSFAKGKLDERETLKQCALREVEEETGLRCRPGTKLPMIEYRDARGRSKAVLYWTMTVIDGEFQPNEEVDAVGWFDLESASSTLSYERDRRILAEIDLEILCPRLTP